MAGSEVSVSMLPPAYSSILPFDYLDRSDIGLHAGTRICSHGGNSCNCNVMHLGGNLGAKQTVCRISPSRAVRGSTLGFVNIGWQLRLGQKKIQFAHLIMRFFQRANRLLQVPPLKRYDHLKPYVQCANIYVSIIDLKFTVGDSKLFRRKGAGSL